MTQQFPAQSAGLSQGIACIMGLGRAGCAIIGRLAMRRPVGPALAAVHTDAKVLSECTAPTKLQIGKRATLGLGASGDPDLGRRAAEDDMDLLRGFFSGKDIVFIVAGLGGGTGTGAAPALVTAAQDAGALTICFVAMPFSIEGSGRRDRAEKGLVELTGIADLTIAVHNEKLFDPADRQISLQSAFEKIADALDTGIFAMWKLVSRRGLINVDFADLRNFTKDKAQPCVFGYGYAGGANRADVSSEAALKSPLLGGESIAAAESLLVSVIGGPSLTLSEVNRIMAKVTEASRRETRVFMGASVDEEMGDNLLVTVIVPSADRTADPPGGSAVGADGQPASVEKKKTRTKTTQDILPLTTLGKGRFKDVEPTIFEGEDVDTPTFIRRNIPIDK